MRNVDQIIAVDHRKVVEVSNYETLTDFKKYVNSCLEILFFKI